MKLPDAGRYRTDNGVRHRVSGLWNHNMITGIGRNSLLAAVASYGRRSMGDRRRHSAEGPRELKEHRDLRADGKLKVVRNKDADVVKATARFDPVLEPERFAALQQELDRRGGNQRGRTRSVDQSRNLLGGRIFDMNCGALTEVEAALTFVKQLTGLADAASKDFGAATKLFELLNARLFVKFEQIQPRKRKLNIVAGGVITLGSAAGRALCRAHREESAENRRRGIGRRRSAVGSFRRPTVVRKPESG